MRWPDFFLFASDAMLVAIAGAGLLLLAVLTLVAEWRRSHRRRIDSVGWVPWTALFLCFTIAGAGLLTLGLQGLLRA